MMDTAVRSYLESVEFLPAELYHGRRSVATLPVVFKLDQQTLPRPHLASGDRTRTFTREPNIRSGDMQLTA